jgi:hypothetical protein
MKNENKIYIENHGVIGFSIKDSTGITVAKSNRSLKDPFDTIKHDANKIVNSYNMYSDMKVVLKKVAEYCADPNLKTSYFEDGLFILLDEISKLENNK